MWYIIAMIKPTRPASTNDISASTSIRLSHPVRKMFRELMQWHGGREWLEKIIRREHGANLLRWQKKANKKAGKR